jgi:DNA-binding GntR family transcriptional regulator
MKSAPELVHEELKAAILSGRLLPGQPVRQDDVATKLGVSRAPVREAMNQLEREGFLEFRPRRGFIVPTLDIDEVEEIFQIRMLLEEHAARTATQRRTIEDIAMVRGLLTAMQGERMENAESIARWAALNREFHSAIVEASQQKRVLRLTDNLRDSVEHYVRVDAATAESLGNARKEHQAIVEAFELGDAETAARLSKEHCQHTFERLMKALRR